MRFALRTKCCLCDQLLGHKFHTKKTQFSHIVHYACMARREAKKRLAEKRRLQGLRQREINKAKREAGLLPLVTLG